MTCRERNPSPGSLIATVAVAGPSVGHDLPDARALRKPAAPGPRSCPGAVQRQYAGRSDRCLGRRGCPSASWTEPPRTVGASAWWRRRNPATTNCQPWPPRISAVAPCAKWTAATDRHHGDDRRASAQGAIHAGVRVSAIDADGQVHGRDPLASLGLQTLVSIGSRGRPACRMPRDRRPLPWLYEYTGLAASDLGAGLRAKLAVTACNTPRTVSLDVFGRGLALNWFSLIAGPRDGVLVGRIAPGQRAATCRGPGLIPALGICTKSSVSGSSTRSRPVCIECKTGVQGPLINEYSTCAGASAYQGAIRARRGLRLPGPGRSGLVRHVRHHPDASGQRKGRRLASQAERTWDG